MYLIDTHAHLYAEQFSADRPAMVERARDNGVDLVLLPNIDRSSIEPMLAAEREYAGWCMAMMGLHPTSVKEDFELELEAVRQQLARRQWVALGEIGIDLYWDKTFFDQQQQAFRQQVAWALDYNLPIVIHSRESIDILIGLLREVGDDRLRGVFHCFTGDEHQAAQIFELGFYIGIGGVLTFKNGGLDRVVQQLPLERMVLETDAPYLAPVPYRGKRNESSYLRQIAERLADLKGRSIDDIAEQTSHNAQALFNIST